MNEPHNLPCFTAATHLNLLQKTGTRRGYFENLSQRVGVGFDRHKDDVVGYLTGCAKSGDGIFVSDGAAKEKCAKVNFRGVDSIKHKQLHFVAYLYELGYGLSLAPALNISHSPGFETPLGIFEGAT